MHSLPASPGTYALVLRKGIVPSVSIDFEFSSLRFQHLPLRFQHLPLRFQLLPLRFQGLKIPLRLQAAFVQFPFQLVLRQHFQYLHRRIFWC